jgi:hypothetical protein
MKVEVRGNFIANEGIKSKSKRKAKKEAKKQVFCERNVYNKGRAIPGDKCL